MPAQYHLSQPFYEDQLFYGTAAQVVARDGACSVFKMKNETGEGIMTRYPVLRGIELIYNDMHIANVRKEENKAPCPDVMEINHCREGRFECEFPDGRTAYLGAGDLAVNMLTHPSSNSWFPLSHYHGISVMVDLPAAQETLRQISFTMGETAVDLYAVPPAVRSGYCKLKALELLLFLASADLPELREKRAYITRTQADTIRAIRTYLVEHLDRRITLPELSRRFGIPLTAMKQNFKTVYGESIGTYMQSYRMQKAMWLLLETDRSIVVIAGQVGYQNASKFSEVFRQFTGSTPTEYRKIPRPIGAESVRLE